jgi:hypothetical protein
VRGFLKTGSTGFGTGSTGFCAEKSKMASFGAPHMYRDGNGYPLPETRWVFALLGYEFGSISLPMGLLMGSNGNPTGT